MHVRLDGTPLLRNRTRQEAKARRWISSLFSVA